MSISGAGGNKSRQLIAYVGPWSVIGDDFGPYGNSSGFTKYRFETEGAGSGYEITIYDGSSQTIQDAIQGVWSPYTNLYQNPNPPPPIPNAGYGALLAIPETCWSPTVGPSASGVPGGAEANPIVTNGLQSQKLFSSYPIYYCRAKITNITAGSGIVKVWAIAIP